VDRFGWFFRDLRFGLRSLNKDRRFALLAILALALGIGATTVIFSAIDCILLDPFIYPHVERLAGFGIQNLDRPQDRGRVRLSVPEFMDFREQNHVYQDIAGIDPIDVLYKSNEGTLLFDGAWVTPSSFETLEVEPLIGRWITSDDGKPGAAPVFVMSYRLWTKEFNRDPSIVGTTMTLNNQPRTLVGIMPPRFLWFNRDVWMPIYWTHSDLSSDPDNETMYLTNLGRLKRGVSLKAAAADIDVIAKRLAKVYPKEFPPHFRATVLSYTAVNANQTTNFLYILLAAVTLLLLIACSNVANLLLARATVREREIAIRASMGATRGRLIRQLLVESFLLSFAGCAAGCLFAYFGLKGIAAVIPPNVVPATAVIALRPIALWFSLGVTILTTFLCGLAPALHAVRGDLSSRLAGAGRGAGGGFRHGKLRAGLVIFEVGLSILLLIGAGLMMRTLFALEHVNLGFDPANVLFARPAFPAGRYDTVAQKRAFFQPVLQRFGALPGVVSVAETTGLPPYIGFGTDVTIPGKPHSDRWLTGFDLCSESYFRTVGMRLMRGRLLSEAEVDSAAHVAVINQMLAGKYFKDEDPIGKQIKFNAFDQWTDKDTPHDAYFEIIGVVGDVKNDGLQDTVLPEAFLPYTISGVGYRGILVRTAVAPLSVLGSVRREAAAVDSGVPLGDTGTLEHYLNRYELAAPRFELVTLSVFAGIGLALVIIGVFSVMAYTVSLQTQGIGVRMALGAQQGDILRMVLLKGLRLIGVGIGVGLLASVGLTRYIASEIWGVTPTDPLTFAAVVVAIVAVGAAACLLPARRATQVDPLTALRYE